ncbi:MAG: TrmJ/YjtD family RNA methyltransferase [Candidatus Micrarchaeota archaeon]|nr:TrmJ/YjtD family RNA methyltransferase [Candidatus Micrarchaeota archaeon]
MKLRVILVEPEYEQNLGYCARVMKNFDFYDLVLVNPKVQIGEEAKMYSKHALDVLSSAKIVSSLEEAIDGCSIVIGSTAVKSGGREVLRVPIAPREAAEEFSKTDMEVGLLIGREGTGLSKEELEQCDAVIRIPSSENYGTLNISHALGIMLYEFSIASKRGISAPSISSEERKIIDNTTIRLVKSLKGIRGERTTILSLKRIFGRGIRSATEGKALINFLKKLENAIVKPKKNKYKNK